MHTAKVAFPKGKAVLVTGSRYWGGDKYNLVKKSLSRFPQGTILIHGDARGVDSLADNAGEALNFVRVRVPYLGHLGKRGGPVRNSMMLELLLGLGQQGFDISSMAFHDALKSSRGTLNMVKQLRSADVKVTLIGKL